MNKVLVISLEKRFKEFEREIKKIVLRILKILNKRNITVEVYLADSQKMRFLNKKFRGRDKATTVLSFEEPRNFIYPKSRLKRIGEIYLNAARITRGSPKKDQRALRGSLADQRESAHLLAHGLLHLVGYNHKKKSDRMKMEKKEQKLLLKITNSKHQITNNT